MFGLNVKTLSFVFEYLLSEDNCCHADKLFGIMHKLVEDVSKPKLINVGYGY